MARQEKCEVNTKGNGFITCDEIQSCIDNGLGDIELIWLTRFTDHSRRQVIRIGKSRLKKVQIKYCPACGVDIETSHPEEVIKDA